MTAVYQVPSNPRDSALIASFEQPAEVLAGLGSILFVTTLGYEIRIWNARASEVLERRASEVIGQRLGECRVDWDWARIQNLIEGADGDPFRLDDVPFTGASGRSGILAFTVTILKDAEQRPVGLVWFGAEVSERRRRQLNEVKSQKLAALGRLAAELAHEMNSPLQYTTDNVQFLRRVILAVGQPNGRPDAPNGTDDELTYLLEEAPDVVEQTLAGLQHLTRVARTLSALVSTPSATEDAKVEIRQVLVETIERVKNESSVCIPFEVNLDQLSSGRKYGHSRLLAEVFRCSLLAVIEAASIRLGGNVTKSATLFVEGRSSQNELTIQVLARDLTACAGQQVETDAESFEQDADNEVGHGLSVARAVMIERLNGRLSVSSRAGEILRVTLATPL